MTRRTPALLLPALLLLLATVPAPPAQADLAVGPPERYVLGFATLPAGVAEGGVYDGATVYAVLPATRALGVLTADRAFKERALSDPDVLYVEPEVEHRAHLTPDDPLFPAQYAPQQVRLPQAWDATLGGAAARLCILDTGVRPTHEDLRAGFLGGWNFVNDTPHPVDDEGHGTHVAGIAAAAVHNARGVAGAGNLGFYAVKVLNNQGSGSSTNVAKGIAWCADNAGPRAVLSLSLGSQFFSRSVADAVKYAASRGALVVASAGNSGPCDGCVGYPGALPEAVAVACTETRSGGHSPRCGSSSMGPEVELAAPGHLILSACVNTDVSYCPLSGTSMAAPLVSGVAALFWSANPALTADQVRERLGRTARDMGPLGRDVEYGFGELDADCLLRDASPCGPPPNDNRSRAETIPVLPYLKVAPTLGATTETGEASPCGGMGATTWFRWVAPGSGRVTARTAGSTFNTVLAAYGGPASQLLACNDNAAPSDLTSVVSFDAAAGETYLLQVGGKGGATGALSLDVRCEGCPANNAFAAATVVDQLPWSVSQSTVGATTEPGEPTSPGPCAASGAVMTGTVWFRWRALAPGTATVDTFNSRYDTILAVYVGETLDALQNVDCNDQASTSDWSQVTFAAASGATYWFQVGGYEGDAGLLQLNVQCAACAAAPPHDDFKRPKVITTTHYTDAVSTTAATTQRGEPQPCGLIGATVWYAFTPRVDADVAVGTTMDSDLDTVIAVHAGSRLKDLAPVRCNDHHSQGTPSRVSFRALADTTYYVQVGGYNGSKGTRLGLFFDCTPACLQGGSNDARAMAIPLARSVTHTQATLNFTMEPGEPAPPRMGATAWFTYTAPAVGLPQVIRVDTFYSSFNTVAAVYVDGVFLPLGYNDDMPGAGTWSMVYFTALPGVTYAVQAGGALGSAGSLRITAG